MVGVGNECLYVHQQVGFSVFWSYTKGALILSVLTNDIRYLLKTYCNLYRANEQVTSFHVWSNRLLFTCLVILQAGPDSINRLIGIFAASEVFQPQPPIYVLYIADTAYNTIQSINKQQKLLIIGNFILWTFYFLLKVQFSRIDNVSNFCDETISYKSSDIAEILPLWLNSLPITFT